MKFHSLLLVCLMALSGCGEHMQFPVTERAQEQLPPNLKIIRMSTKNIDHVVSVYHQPSMEYGGNPPAGPGQYVYRVGPGDQLRVQVWTTPERTTSEAERNMQPVEGPVVDETGVFFYPFVGEVRAEGRTTRQIRTELTERLQTYLKEPQVEVAVETYRAHRVTIVGAVDAPGPTTLTNVPLRLVDLLNASGAGDTADLSHVKLRRGGREYTVNVRRFLERGEARHNPVLLPDDTVYVPENRDNEAFVFGEIRTKPVVLGEGETSLTELLAEVGGIDRQRANARGVFVFRRTEVTQDGFDVVFQFDLSNAATLIMMKSFPIVPQDIVFVTKDPVTRWTDTVGRILAPASSVLEARRFVDDVTDAN